MSKVKNINEKFNKTAEGKRINKKIRNSVIVLVVCLILDILLNLSCKNIVWISNNLDNILAFVGLIEISSGLSLAFYIGKYDGAKGCIK